MQRYFHEELRQLRDDLVLMGERTLDMTRLSLRALEEGDNGLALQVRGMDDGVDDLEKRVDREIMRYLTLFGPMGGEGDIVKARSVLEGDAEIDRLNRENYIALFGKAGDAAKVSASHVELIFISKAYERIGDHAKNIAEQVIFLLSGEDVRHAR